MIPKCVRNSGIKLWGDDIYVTVPRWRPGVPSTLNKVVRTYHLCHLLPRFGRCKRHLPRQFGLVCLAGCSSCVPCAHAVSANGSAVLQPFPSWDWNDQTDPAKIVYVQSMEIDPKGYMWILDVGRVSARLPLSACSRCAVLISPRMLLHVQLNIFGSDPSQIVNYAPKLLICDLATGNMVRTFVFPDAVAPYNSSFLNDIVLDTVNGVAYISDTGNVGGIVVYDFKSNSARRFGGDATQQHDPAFTISINGVTYPGITTNEDGIALSLDVQVGVASSISPFPSDAAVSVLLVLLFSDVVTLENAAAPLMRSLRLTLSVSDAVLLPPGRQPLVQHPNQVPSRLLPEQRGAEPIRHHGGPEAQRQRWPCLCV